MASQRFTAQNQPACLLSLRDVKRCVELVYWFKDGSDSNTLKLVSHALWVEVAFPVVLSLAL